MQRALSAKLTEGLSFVPLRFRQGCPACISIPPARRSRATSLYTREAFVRTCKTALFPGNGAKARTFTEPRGSAFGSLVQRALSAKLTEGLSFVPLRFRQDGSTCISIPPARRSRATSLCTREALYVPVKQRFSQETEPKPGRLQNRAGAPSAPLCNERCQRS